MFHHNWCKQAVLALKQGKPVEPYCVFDNGPGCVGKSNVIHFDTIKLLRLSGTIEPDDVIDLIRAPTGVTTFIVSGMTLQSVLLIGTSKNTDFQPHNLNCLNSLRNKAVSFSIVDHR